MKEVVEGDTTYFEAEWEEPTKITISMDISKDDAIYLAQSLATVHEGAYKGTQVIAAGGEIVVYLKRDEKSFGTAKISLQDIVMAAVAERLKMMDNLDDEHIFLMSAFRNTRNGWMVMYSGESDDDLWVKHCEHCGKVQLYDGTEMSFDEYVKDK